MKKYIGKEVKLKPRLAKNSPLRNFVEYYEGKTLIIDAAVFGIDLYWEGEADKPTAPCLMFAVRVKGNGIEYPFLWDAKYFKFI